MTTKVTPFVADIEKLATALSTTPNDLLTLINTYGSTAVSEPSTPGEDGYVWTANSGTASWQPVPSFTQEVISSSVTYTVGPSGTYTTLGDFLEDIRYKYIEPGVLVTVRLIGDTNETKPLIWAHPQSHQIVLTSWALPTNVVRTINASVPVYGGSIEDAIYPTGYTGFYLPPNDSLIIEDLNLQLNTTFTQNGQSMFSLAGHINVKKTNSTLTAGVSSSAEVLQNSFEFKNCRFARDSYGLTIIRGHSSAPGIFRLSGSTIGSLYIYSTVPGTNIIRVDRSSANISTFIGQCYFNISGRSQLFIDEFWISGGTLTIPGYTIYESEVYIRQYNGGGTYVLQAVADGSYIRAYRGSKVIHELQHVVGSPILPISFSTAGLSAITPANVVFCEMSDYTLISGAAHQFLGSSATNHAAFYGTYGSTIKVGGSVSPVYTTMKKTNLLTTWNGSGVYQGL